LTPIAPLKYMFSAKEADHTPQAMIGHLISLANEENKSRLMFYA
jgi:hypothetical protein